jgi:hypothetical protein
MRMIWRPPLPEQHAALQPAFLDHEQLARLLAFGDYDGAAADVALIVLEGRQCVAFGARQCDMMAEPLSQAATPQDPLSPELTRVHIIAGGGL